ncbi:hypothetical protein [Methylorubrum aminovorans]|nr:hypothetical protein [Methylorubrum aminovorans]
MTIPCGGCGAKSDAERCIGCLHDFGDDESAWLRADGAGVGPGWTTPHDSPVSPQTEAAARRIAARRAGGAYADAPTVPEAAWRSEIHSAEAALFGIDAVLATPRTDSAERTAGEGSWTFDRTRTYLLAELERLKADLHTIGEDLTDDQGKAVSWLDVAYGRVANVSSVLAATPAPATPPGVPDSVRALSEDARDLLNSVLDWLRGVCPCGDAGPAQCPVCGARINDPTGFCAMDHRCKIPAHLLGRIEQALGLSAHPAGQSTGQGAGWYCQYNRTRISHPTQCGSDASCQCQVPAPDSTRTGQVGTEEAEPGASDKAVREACKDLREAAADMLISLPAHWHDDATIRLTDAAADAETALSKAEQDDLYALAARPAAPEAQGACIKAEVVTMQTSAGADYYVWLTCGDRSVTPYMFKERYKAEYEAAHFAWVFGLRDEAPDLMAYDEVSHPNEPALPSSGQGGR